MILHIIGFACLANLGADFLEQFEWLPSKPFKCSMCSGFWYSIGPSIAIWGWQGLLVSAITGITAELIYRLINRL